jgi:hypothetical protein
VTAAVPASEDAKPQEERRLPWNIEWSIWTALAGSLALGILPVGIFGVASQSVTALRALFGLP